MSLEAFESYVDIARKEIAQTQGPRLVVLNNYLEKAKDMLGVSNTKLKQLASASGLCLANFCIYGQALKKFLRKHPCQIISRQKAKTFQFVKYFLIKL